MMYSNLNINIIGRNGLRARRADEIFKHRVAPRRVANASAVIATLQPSVIVIAGMVQAMDSLYGVPKSGGEGERRDAGEDTRGINEVPSREHQLAPSPSLKLLCSVPVTPATPTEKSRRERDKRRFKRPPRGSHGMRRSRSFERRSLITKSYHLLPEQAKPQEPHAERKEATSHREKTAANNCSKDSMQAVVRLSSKLICEGAKSRLELDSRIENTSISTKRESVATEKHSNTKAFNANSVKSGASTGPLQEQARKTEIENMRHLPILKYPAVMVSKIGVSEDTLTRQAEHQNPTMKKVSSVSSVLLAISFKRSLLKQKESTVSANDISESVADITESADDNSESIVDDYDTSSTTPQDKDRLATLVAERQDKIEAEMDTLVNNVLFKLNREREEKAKNKDNGQPAITHSIADSDEDLDKEILKQLSKSPPPGCMDLSKKVETKLGAIVDEIDILRCSFSGQGNALEDPLEDKFFTTPRIDDSRRGKAVKRDVPKSVKIFIDGSAKAAPATDRKKSSNDYIGEVGHESSGSYDFDSIANPYLHYGDAANGFVGGFASESVAYSYYEDNTVDATFNGTFEDGTIDDTLDETLEDYTLNTFDDTLDETIGGCTLETFDQSLLEEADLDETLRLLRTRASLHGVSEAQLLERIQKEQKRRKTEGSKKLIEV